MKFAWINTAEDPNMKLISLENLYFIIKCINCPAL